MATRQEAQQRFERLASFRAQLDELEREGVVELTEEQRARISEYLNKQLAEFRARFDLDVSDREKRLSLGMRIVSALGGLALCAAIYFFFIRIWGSIPAFVQIPILIAAPIVGMLGMEFAARRERTLYFTALLGSVTVALFVLNLVTIGEIFNVTPSPNAFLAWGVFAMLLAYTYGLRSLLAAGLASMALWTVGTIATITGTNWAMFDRPEHFLAAGTIIAAAGFSERGRPEFASVYRFCGALIAFLAMLILGLSGSLSHLPWDSKSVQAFYQAVSLISTAGVMWISVRRGWSAMVNLGATFFTLNLLAGLVEWWWDWMPKYLFFLIIGAIALGLLVVFRRLRARLEEA